MSPSSPSSSLSSSISSATTSAAVYPRPVFASDLVAQRKKYNHCSSTSSSSGTSQVSKHASPSPASPARSSTTPSPSLLSPGSGTQSLPGQRTNSSTTYNGSMMDLSSKLGDLPTIHLPDFHLPDLQRLKQQLNKHTPSFSLKSLQHTFHVPSYSSYTSASSSSSSSASSASSIMTSADSAKPRPSFASRLSIRRNSNSKPTKSPTGSLEESIAANATTGDSTPKSRTLLPSSNAFASADPSTSSASSPISIPTHPSNYLIKKQVAAENDILPGPGAIPNASSSMATSSTKASSKSSSSASKSPVGHLFLQIIEARNLTLVNSPSMSRPYCLVEYDQNELITPPAMPEADSMGRRGGTDIFAMAMAASSPKWRHDAEFDVVRPGQQVSITIYDSETEDDLEPAKRFLGQVKLSPSEIHNRMIDSWFRLQGREADEQVTGEIRVTIKYQAIESRHLSTSDFDILRVLGVGSFGKVYQVRKKDTGRIYAMKVLVKKQVIEQKQVEHTIAERNVLIQALQSPFIVGLKFSFQTPTKLYLVQDFMNGGELFFHMQNEGTFSEPRARFYTAELVLALEHLHSCNVVYRDLKPENVLLSSQGHLVLVDFGLCKQNVTEDERTHTFCGTTEYLAPEIIKGTGYGKAVDWWSLGVLLYEMLVGGTPFEDDRTQGTHHKILHQPIIFPTRPGQPSLKVTAATQQGKQQAQFSGAESTLISGAGISASAQDLIQRFLDKNPKTRLGSGPNGAEAVAAIKAHPFFQGIDFVRLQTRDVTPPFQPHVGVTGDLDVSNFDAHFTDQTATLSIKGSGSTRMKGTSSRHLSPGSISSSPSTVIDGDAGSFMLQQQQRAANQYRQQQKRGDNTTLNPHVLSRGRRSSNSWSSYRTLSNDSLFTLNEPGSPMPMRQGQGTGATAAPLHRSMTAYRARALQQQQQQQLLQQQQRQQEYFKGFTFEGESVLETMKRQDDLASLTSAQSTTFGEGEEEEEERYANGTAPSDQNRGIDIITSSGGSGGGLSGIHGGRQPNQLFSGEPGSIDSIFGSM